MDSDKKILASVNSPEELRALSDSELKLYTQQIRSYIIEECATNPGHLSSSLGVVELTVALHRAFDTPKDKLIWDVGHQCYPHKIITGRRDLFPQKRTLGGISGFPKRSESEYDPFGGGHASVSISAAFGMAKAAELRGEKEHVVAVIGDGSMTGGLAFEGLNNAGESKNSDLLVILNDNHMSIDKSTGALSRYLLHISTSARYNKIKNKIWVWLAHTPKLLSLLRMVGNSIKQGLLKKSNLFESLNFRYFGPVDGHDIKQLERTLCALKNIPGAKLLHVITVKGKGYEPAENKTEWHAPGQFNPATGERIAAAKSADKYQDVFGQTLLELAQMDDRVVGITPAMVSGSSMNILQEVLPHRCFDVGIAEGHAVTFAAGLAAAGMVPFCAIYSSFAQRAYDNIIHDVATQRLPVVLCLDRAGLVGEDGSTHHGVADLVSLSAIPNLVVIAPRNEIELRQAMFTALNSSKAFIIRYPRGAGSGTSWRNEPFKALPIGRGEKLRTGANIAIVTIGTTADLIPEVTTRVESEMGFTPAHYDLRYASPLDREMILAIASEFDKIITIEDGLIRGGVGESLAALLSREGVSAQVKQLGIPNDRFIDHGTPAELRDICGFGVDGIVAAIREIL
ncbi:MAG: 1-deoxy-D-xylulose-5-phosphate synthase [Rikenellaceae bacterium]